MTICIYNTIFDKRTNFYCVQGLKSYEAFQRYPYEVNRLQTLEPKLAGGCTAAVAVIANNFLFVANVGDSRVLLIKERPDGTLGAEQLTQDDSVENDRELVRLEALGLRREALLRAGRLGTQENTRSIGDYNIKEGYKDTDSLRYAGMHGMMLIIREASCMRCVCVRVPLVTTEA